MMRKPVILALILIACSIFVGANPEDVPTNLINHWKLDETPATHNTVIDDAQNNDDGILDTGNDGLQKDTSGKIDGALDFDGTNDHVDLSSIDATDYYDEYTISAWVKADQLAGDNFRTIAATDANSAGGFGIRVDSGHFNGDDQFVCFAGDGPNSNVHVFSTTEMQLDEWYHVVCTYDGTDLSIYVNGVGEDSQPASVTDSGIDGFQIGRLKLGNLQYDPWDGLIDDVAIWDRELSSSEVLQVYSLSDGNDIPEIGNVKNVSLVVMLLATISVIIGLTRSK